MAALQQLLALVPWYIKAKDKDVEAGKGLLEFTESFVKDVIQNAAPLADDKNQQQLQLGNQILQLLNELQASSLFAKTNDASASAAAQEKSDQAKLFIIARVHLLLEQLHSTIVASGNTNASKSEDYQDLFARYIVDLCLPQLANKTAAAVTATPATTTPADQQQQQQQATIVNSATTFAGIDDNILNISQLQVQVCYNLAELVKRNEFPQVTSKILQICESQIEHSVHESLENPASYHIPTIINLIALILTRDNVAQVRQNSIVYVCYCVDTNFLCYF